MQKKFLILVNFSFGFNAEGFGAAIQNVVHLWIISKDLRFAVAQRPPIQKKFQIQVQFSFGLTAKVFGGAI